MTIFAFAKVNSPLALAVKSFAEYFSWQIEVQDSSLPRDAAKIRVEVIEATVIDAATMRKIEKIREGRERPILLFAPPPTPGPISLMLGEMANLFQISTRVKAEELIEQMRQIIGTLNQNRDFYLEAVKAEEAFLAARYLDALNAAKRMLSTKYEPFVAHMILGRTLFRSGRFNPALQHAEKALNVRPKSMAAASLVAAAHQKLGQSHIAERYLSRFLPFAETSILYMVQLGDVYFENGKIPDAKSIYQKASAIDPGNTGSVEGLLAVSILEGEFRKAEELNTTHLAHFDLGRFCNLRAISLTVNRQFKNAEKLYLNTVNLLGDDKDVYKIYFNLGLCLKKSGNLQRSIKYFEMCQKIAPEKFNRVAQQLKKIRNSHSDQKASA